MWSRAQDGEILNLGTGAASWWEVNGIGCRPYFSVNASFGGSFNDQLEDFLRPPRPDLVDGCLLNYYYVEVIHAAIQLTLSVIYQIPTLSLFFQSSDLIYFVFFSFH